MAAGHVQKYTSGRHLLKALTDNPELPTFVPTLPASGLKVLIDEIGLQDAGALIECSTAAQLSGVIDDAVWKPSTPGAPDKFDPAEFREWLDALLEIGDEFAVERLHAIDEDLLVMALMGFLVVVDLDSQMLDGDNNDVFDLWEATVDYKELYGPYEVRPRRENDWETIQPLLAALHVVDPEFLRALLTRCCLPESLLRFRDNVAATRDAAGEHRERREQQGFVSPETAGGFLNAARDGDLATLTAVTEYDLDTQDYFKRSLRATLDEVTGSNRVRHQLLAHDGAEQDETPPDPEQLAALESVVAELELQQLTAPVQRLAGPGSDGRSVNVLQVALNELADEQPSCLVQRMKEAAYLSNLLMTGTRVGGEALTHKESVAAVMATCNLGYEFAPQFDMALEPGLIGVFRIGWHLVQRVPLEVIGNLRRIFSAGEVQQRLGARGWIAADVATALSSDELHESLAAGRLTDAHDVIQMLGLVVEDHAVEHLERLVDHLPTTVEAADGIRIRQRRRFIEHEADLEEIQRFLGALSTQLRE